MYKYLTYPDISISTNETDESESSEFWHDLVCQQYVDLDCKLGVDKVNGNLAVASLGDIHVSEAHSVSQQLIRDKRHVTSSANDPFIFNIQLEGTGKFTQNGESKILVPGDCLLNDSTQPFSWDFQKDFRHLILQVPRSVMCGLLIDAEQLSGTMLSGNSVVGNVVTDFMKSMARRINTSQVSSGETLFLAQRASELIASSMNFYAKENVDATLRKGAKDSLLSSVKRFIESNLSSPSLTPDNIAALHKISLRSLYSLFTQESTTLSQFIKQKRLEKISQELLVAPQSKVSATQIAFHYGFNSAAHFSRAFKQHFGVTPREYRAIKFKDES